MALTLLATAALLPGTYAFGPVSVPVGTTGVQVVLDRTAMALWTGTIDKTVEVSYDGGKTWQGLMAETGAAAGSTGRDPIDSVIPNATWTQTGLDQPSNLDRQVRGTVLVNGAALTTGVKVNWLT